MKRILICMICFIMCCSLIIAPVSAAQGQTNFLADSMILSKLYQVKSTGNAAIDWNDIGVNIGDNQFTFSKNVRITLNSSYTYGGLFDFTGTWDNDPGSNKLVYITFRISYNPNININFDKVYSVPIALTAYDSAGQSVSFTDVAIAEESPNSMLLTFMQNISSVDEFNIVSDAVRYSVLIPIETVGNVNANFASITSISVNIYFEVTYQLPDINYDSLILESVNNSNDLINSVISNQNETIKQIIASKAVISANGQKLDEIASNQNTIIRELEDLPSQIVSGLINGNVGSDYNKQLDTSEIVAYESALDRVMEQVDVDQVIDVMGDGISLNQPGMYNEQSFNSVSGLVMDIIDATSLMPLVMLSMSIGLACFIIGRSRNL